MSKDEDRFKNGYVDDILVKKKTDNINENDNLRRQV